MEPDAWMKLLRELGWPTVLLLLVGYVLRRVLIWFAPRIEKIVDGHITLVSALEKSVKEDTDGHRTTHEKLDKQHKHIETAHGKLDEIHSVVRKLPPKETL